MNTEIRNIRLIALTLVAITFNSCTEDEPAPLVLPKLGEAFEGGIVFHLDTTGQHGLVAATSDQSKTAPWFNLNFVETGATSNTDGSINTTAIIKAQGNSGSYAAKLCRDYKGGGFSDWFLPSKDQLNILYGQKNLVGGFSDDIYWSSTESSLGDAWVQNFLDGMQHLDNTSDGAGVHTRAIRAF